ncbi:MAG TPA: plastocyanin/azurin family copper-binding protein [Dokdonella sp.]|nr:plastocyanin/azurin family copper-binding protein [Dokdonella sp.]
MRPPAPLAPLALLALLAGPACAADYLVLVGPGQTFNPAELTIAAGDRVTFRNSGGTHNVKANDNSFRCANGCDGDGQGGDGAAANNIWHFSRVFPSAGTIGYYCETHGTPSNGMRGTIVVLPSTPVELQSFGIH